MIVISGGQSGADQSGWRAARLCGLPTGGWMPAGWLTEEGPRPAFAALYDARELVGGDYPARTRRNVRDADAIVWYGSSWSAGAKATFSAARQLGKPVFVVGDLAETAPELVAGWIAERSPSTLMVAGNRRSKSVIPCEAIEEHLVAAFALLGFPPQPA